MRTHVEWLMDCHRELMQAFENFREKLSVLASFDGELDGEKGECFQNVVCQLDDLCHELQFNEIDEALEYFAIVYAASHQGLVDDKYASYHEALHSPVNEAVVIISEWLETHPDDWRGAVEKLKPFEAVVNRIDAVFRHNPGLLRREFADAINDAEGRFAVTATGLRGSDAFGRGGKTGDGVLDYSELLEADVKNNRVRYKKEWYNTTSDATQLVDTLLKNYPDWVSAREGLTKPSRTKKSLSSEVQALIETKSGKGYRLKAPGAPEMGRKMPASSAP